MKIRITRNLFIILLIDILLLFCSIYVAFLIRFDFAIPEKFWSVFISITPYVLFFKLIWFYMFDLYKGMWRYTSLSDLINIVKASTVSAFFIIVFILYINRFENVPRSVFIIDWCLTVIFIITQRVVVKVCFEQFTENIQFKDVKNVILQMFIKGSRQGEGVIIIGAGDCGEKICREFRKNASLKSHVVGFLDDDISKIGRKIHGISVLDQINNLDQVVESTGAGDVIIAIPTLSASRIRQIINLCKQLDVKFKTVPDMGELIDGKITVNSIRNVEYRDLLGRDPVVLDKIKIGRYLGQKTILVTGAGGSIGTGLCKQICRYEPEAIVLFDRAESPLYEIDLELKKSFPHVNIIPFLGDLQSKDEINNVFDLYKPGIVFHAAAYKHVPMLEKYPWKAVTNNIVSTQYLVEVAAESKCEKFVFVSTDKAVNPTNVMGTSKRISEIIVQGMNKKEENIETEFITVRFGNVIGSVGSVIPLFKKQIKEGGPVTITHPEIIRFFMLIPEACQLILQAGAMGKGGEIFILEMGEPVKIDDMARDLIKFSGFKPEIDIQIKYTGLRPGEKLYEELMTNDENLVQTDHDKILVLSGMKYNMDTVNTDINELKKIANQRDRDKIIAQLMKIVPEFTPTGIGKF